MSKHKGVRKTLSVFMAVLMVMSCWVFTPISLKAEALTAGSYYVEIVYKITNEGSSLPNKYEGETKWKDGDWNSSKNNRGGISLHFKRNNGTGTTGEVYWNVGQSSKDGGQVGTTKDATVENATGYIDDSTSPDYYARATIPGFPTNIFAFLDYNSSFTKAAFKITELKIASKKGGTFTTLWKGGMEVSSHLNVDRIRLNSNGTFTDKYGGPSTSTESINWVSPKASKIMWDTSSLADLTIHTGSNNVSRLAKFHVVDQYGVNMSTAALSSLNTPVGATVKSTNYATSGASLGKTTTLNTTTTNNLYYTVSDTSANYQVDVVAKPALKSLEKGLNERLVTVTAKAGSGVTSSKTFKIYDPKYKISFEGNGGVVSPTYYNVYYGESLKSQKALDNNAATYPVGGTRTGYTWLGMFDNATGGNPMNIEEDVTAAKIYYAHWDKNLYTVVFLNRKGEYVDVQYIYHGEGADATTPAAKLPKVEHDSAKHYTLNESAPWDPVVTNVTGNIITKAKYTAEEHDFDNGVAVSATCHSGAGTKYTCEICGYSYIKDESADRAPHQFGDAVTITKEPTCTATGLGYKTCTVCGAHSDDVTVPATGHSYKITKTNATCSKEGSITYTCTKGDDTHTETLPKTQHNMVAGTKVAASCTSAAYTPYKCSNCSHSYNVYDATQPAIGHDWSAWSETKAATNTEDGIMSHTCSKCNKTETVTIPKGGHTFPTTPTSETPATCHSTGTQTFKCTAHTNCGVSITVTTAKTAHNYKTTITNATCTAAGSVVSACQNPGCTEKITTAIPANGHNYDTSKVTKEPTCTETGIRTYTCSKCNATKTETIEATGHKNVTIDPTCTQEGKTVCALCGYTTTTAKLGHSYGAWETVVAATCKNQGVRKHVCTRTDCGHTEIETTPITDHTWNAEKTVDYDSTCSTVGQKSTHCTVCGVIKDGSKEEIAKKAHTMGAAETVVAATCTGSGVTKTACTVCGYTETATTNKLGHDYTIVLSNTSNTCTEAGVKKLKCSRCDATDTVVTQPTGHNFVEGTPVAASCKDAGHVTMTCTNCNESYEKYTTAPTNTHSWEYTTTVSHGKTVISGECSVCGATFSTSADSEHELKNVKSYTPATCVNKGTLILECAVSGCTKTHEIELAVNANAHANVKVEETKATCTTEGRIITKCADCGKTLSTTTVPATGHAFNTQTAYSVPTCKSEGSVTYKCDHCNATKTDKLAVNPDAHKFEKGAHHDATCKLPAYDEYKCKYCGKAYSLFDGEANGHTYTTTTSQSGTTLTITCKCSVCGDTHTQTVEVAEGHNYSDVTITKQPTCTAEGTMTIACDGKHKAGCTSVITVSVPKNPQAHNIETTYTAPTCENGGSVVTACTNNCGLTEKKIEIAPLGHEWDNGKVTTAADCENDGVMTYTCKRGCGKTKTEVIAKTGHNWDNGMAHDADCTHGKYIHFTCDNCDKTYDVVENGAQALGHSWDNGTVTKQPTCTEDGVKTYGCTRSGCKVTRTEPIGKLGHNFVAGTKHNATCTSAAYTEYKCANCDSSYNDYNADQPAVGHDWGDWVTVTESTNSTAGLMRRTCKKDASHTEEVEIPAGGHEFSTTPTSEIPATCTSEGKQTFKCKNHDNCGVSIEVTTAKIAHTLETTVEAATCENAGSVTTKCTKCSEVNEVTEIPALGHKYDDTKKDVHPADCTHSGYTTYTCVRNGCTNTINVFDENAKGHVWGKTATASTATCTASGMATYKCENCNSTIEVEVAALGHDYSVLTEDVSDSTCSTVGHKTYKCSRCDSTHTEYSDKLGEHKFGTWQEVQTATDVLPGIKVRQCEVCGLYEYEYSDPAGEHVYKVTSKTEATCTTDGEIVYTCVSEHCSCKDGDRATYTEVIPATGHNKILNVVDATCTAEGHARIECKTCGDVLENKTIGAKGHTYGETPDSVTAPTCSADGKIVYNCTVCGEPKTVTVVKIPNAHNWVLESTQTADCTQAGYETYKCSICGEIYKKFISDRTDHVVDESKTETKAATCKEAGYTKEYCSCGQLMSTEIINPNPNAHNWVDMTAEAEGCLKSGYTYKKCDVCGQIKDIVVNAAADHLYTHRTTKKATCDVGGEVEIYCETCKKVVETIETAPLGHNYDDGVVTPANCKTAGSVVFTCQRDESHKLTKEIPATGAHNYKKTDSVAATCKNSAYDLYVCADCGDSYKEITGDAAAHNYQKQNDISTNATCTAAGHNYFKCANCDAAYDYEIPATGHSYKSEVTQTASCQGAEITKYTCTDCGDNYEVITKVPTAHSWTEWTTTKTATENEAGEQERHCEVCNEKEKAPIPATGSHVMEEDITKYVPATCETEGKRVYVCRTHNNCTADYTVTIAALGHQTSIDYKAADCKEAGHANLVCTREGCGKTLETKEIPQLKHSFTETSKKYPTCVDRGVINYKCDNCGETASTELPATGAHKLSVLKKVEATCKTQGYTLYKCDYCEYTCMKDLTELAPHTPGEKETVSEPTCTTSGLSQVKCTECDTILSSELITPKKHSYTETVTKTVDNADGDTCLKAEYTYNKCACGAIDESSITVTAPKGHDWGEWTVVTPSTNTADGEMQRVCKNDPTHIETVTVPMGDHTFDTANPTSEKKATCYEKGEKTFECTAHRDAEGKNTCGVSITVETKMIQHDLRTVRTEGNCTETGTFKAKCVADGCVYSIETVLPAIGHEYGEGKITKEATCKDEGEVTFTCTRTGCGHKLIKSTPTVPHDYIANGKPVAATCIKSGYQNYKCKNCDDNYDVILEDAAGHTYISDPNNEDVAPTCTTEGHVYKKCKDCNANYSYAVSALGHDYSELIENVKSTCNTVGYKTYKCSRCEDKNTVYESALSGHDWEGWKTVQTATATQPGIETNKCKTCGLYDYIYTDPSGEHDYDGGVITKSATCTEDGVKTYTCKRTHCDCTPENPASYTVTIPATGHKAKLEYADATCAADGYARTVCDSCGELLEEKIIARKDHIWTVKSVEEATCEHTGTTTYECGLCKATKTEDIATVNHEYLPTGKYIDATCTAPKYERYACTYCGGELLVKVGEADGHDKTENYKVVDPATCSEAGYSEWRCHCGALLGAKVIKPDNHTWETVNVTLDSECNGAGYSYEKCSVCGVIKADSIVSNEIGHEYTYTVAIAPTCETKGEIIAKCNVCDKVEIKITVPAIGHEYGEGEITKEATCKDEGKVTFTCTRTGCGHKLIKSTPTVPHDYIANGKPVAATCLKSGYQNYKCKNCDDNYNVILENATGHTYTTDPSHDDVEATCTTAGHVYKKCANCSAAYDYEIPAKGHTYTATVTQQGDCAKAEITTYTCSVCADGTQGHSYTEITAAPTGEHKWTAWTTTKPATENEAGEQERHCEVCNEKETAPIPATGSHTLVEDKAQHVDATCEGEGKIVYVCTKHDNCTAGYTVTLAPLGHKAKLQHEDAKCNVGGYSRVVCTVCDKVLDETTIAALKHSFVEIEGTRVAPKCNKDGSISYKCENCGEEKTVAIEAVTDAHKLVVDKTVESTCTEQGYTLYKCENDCGYTRKDYLKPLAPHTAVTHETVVEPTCEGIGTVRNICSCGAIVSVEAVPAKGHNYETKTAAGEGCLTSGYTYEECTVCGNIRNIKVSQAANHEYEQRVTPATCTADGTVEIYCKNCDKAVKTITVSALGHNFGGTPTVDKSTCEHEGSVTYTCQRTDCNETLTQKLDTVPHNYQFEKAVAATCLNSGYDLFKCADCPAEYMNITSPATGHHYGDDPEHANVAASCFEDGHVYKKCANCDAAYDYVVPATGEHVYDSGTVVTPATCLDSEVTEYRCTTDGCTASYREVTGKAKGHNYTNWTYSHSTATGTCACGATITVENVDKEAGHDWIYNGITKPATCKNVGYIEFICGDGTDCTATLTKAYGPIADAHVWDDGKVTKEPECETDGVKTYTCTECGETKTETVAKLGHEHTVFVERVEATCTADGHITYKCSRCDSTKTELIANNENNHSYKPVVTAPTCLDDGYVTMICELCGHEGEKTVNADTALGHDVEVITVDPTCTEAGSKITQCKRCHTVLKTEGIAPVDHTWDDGVITTEAKCEKDGVKTFTCSVCKTTKEETIARLGHDYSVTAETVDSTCVADGHTTYKCSRCDSTKTELIPKDADKHTLESVTVEATCLEDGYTVDRCKLCGYESEKTDIVKALGHDEETVIVNPTCTEAGSKTVRCKRCSTVLSTEGIVPLGHDYITTEITAATCIDSGENRITCSRCDYIVMETVPAKGHKWDNGTVVTDGDCETKKVTRFTCTECGITKDVLSGDLGKHDYKFVKTVAPTCTDEGYDLYECSKCHKQQQTKFVDALGHDWGYWNIVKYPTETETGLQERYCNRCHEREEQVIVYGKFYLVTFYNYDGTRLMPPAYYEYGAKALRPKTDPVKAADTSYTYEYIGWNYDDRQIDFVTERMAIIAQYKAHERYYTVTYKDEDGAVLAVVPNIPFSQIADRYPNSVPTKASDELNNYTFSSWAITANSNTGEAVAVATYKATEKKPGAQPAGKPGIFSKFIEWLKNLFRKLFGKG